jgi:4-hydroxybenzoate polyprenyltransferase
LATTKQKIDGLIQLTRWQEHVSFVVPLTLLGALLAIQAQPDGVLDWRLVAVTIANILVVAFAFMINDIEDAPDDAREAHRAAKNPVTSGRVDIRVGYFACGVVALLSLILFAFGGTLVFVTGSMTLILSHLYSWRPVRLKAWPITDIVSHSLMLSGLLMMAGYFVYHGEPGVVWFVAVGVTFFSVYGQLYNQIRDFNMDTAAGLRNTAIILGETNARRAAYLFIVLCVGSLLIAVVQGVFPLWLAVPLIGGIIISSFFSTENDLRGTKAVDLSGKMQVQGIIAVNLTMVAWLVVALAGQIF